MMKKKKNMELNNKTHSKISALEFLKDYEDLDYILDDVDEINELFEEIVEYLDKDSFEKYKDDTSIVFNLYISFLNSLSGFEQLSTSLMQIKEIIVDLDLNTISENKRSFIIELIRAILKDISAWKRVCVYKKRCSRCILYKCVYL